MADRDSIKGYFDFGPRRRTQFDVFDNKGRTKFMGNGGFDNGQRLDPFCDICTQRGLNGAMCASTDATRFKNDYAAFPTVRPRRNKTSDTNDKSNATAKGAPGI